MPNDTSFRIISPFHGRKNDLYRSPYLLTVDNSIDQMKEAKLSDIDAIILRDVGRGTEFPEVIPSVESMLISITFALMNMLSFPLFLGFIYITHLHHISDQFYRFGSIADYIPLVYSKSRVVETRSQQAEAQQLFRKRQ